MSVPVPISELGAALSGVGSGYLLTTPVGDPAAASIGRVKVVSVDPVLVDGVLRTQPSKGSAANLASNPIVTLVFPPLEQHGFTLLVDGRAEVAEDAIVVTPESAIWHRPASR
jgi:hypothetical protein